MARKRLPFRVRGVISDTNGSRNDTGMTSLGASRPSGQHFSQSKKSRTFPARDLESMSDDDVWKLFKRVRWSETDGKPACPKCQHGESIWLANQRRWKCKECRHQYSVTSSTILAYKRMDIREVFRAARMFAMMPKGLSAIAISHELGCDYQTAWVLEHKFREAMLHSLLAIDQLHGTIEVDGCWVGGYIKPESAKINRVDRRLVENQNGKRRVVVGARERGMHGRTIVNVFDSEAQAVAWIREKCARDAQIYADEGMGWLNLRGTHKVEQVNHSERYAGDKDGKRIEINTNQMESYFSRLRRIEEGTHHHIGGTYLLRYAAEAAWRENNRHLDHRAKTELLIAACLKAPPSRSFSGYWQHHGANHEEFPQDDVFGAFLAGLGLDDEQ